MFQKQYEQQRKFKSHNWTKLSFHFTGHSNQDTPQNVVCQMHILCCYFLGTNYASYFILIHLNEVKF